MVENRLLEFLVVIAWNVYVGNTAASVRKALAAFIKKHNPDVIVLMEATRLYGEMESLGYTVVQLKPRPLRKGNQPGQANIAILVSPDYVVRKKFSLHMLTFWKGPKHGWAQDPRVYRAVNIRRKDDPTARTWAISGAHTPFGVEARAESRRRLVEWFKGLPENRPAVMVLDANMGLHDFKSTIATPSGAEASGIRIDLEAHKNCEMVKETNLGKGISDHPAIKRKYAARRRDA